MKIDFRLPQDGTSHVFCTRCKRESVDELVAKKRLRYTCRACGHADSRALIVDPAINWWLDGTQEYWHEAAGVFMARSNRQFLFFERTSYPFGLTVPAGHVDAGEQPLTAANRELYEEVGIRRARLVHVATDDVRGDECRRGADAHRWHAFAGRIPAGASIKVNQKEGLRPVWLSLEQALRRDLIFVVRRVILHHGQSIQAAVM